MTAITTMPTRPEVSRRLAELGLRRNVDVQLGGKTSGGGRVVSVGKSRYALDKATLRSLGLI